ncbi:MAG: tryptophan--tRNA ligase [Candidatus Omnitrophica bacterium]|nr:tryptophan--tRNA ligase [Candidatus Omnitrophota bacterium]
MKKRILSGMRPTGRLHLGHLVGTLDNWVSLQDEYECFYMVADWHALMSEYADPKNIKEYILDNVLDWLAFGISPAKSTIFIQSQVKEHLELYMFFSLITPLGLLERCPTYKEQLRQVTDRDISTYGFLGYPVLQAADILLYKAEAVPVGEDQLPHLELTRQIAKKFNHLYKKELFPSPQAILTKTSRLLGLDGRKMSKSYNNYIALSDSSEEILKKVAGMFTDPTRIRLADAGHPQACNVFSYYTIFAGQKKNEIEELCRKAKIGCTECKKQLGKIIADFLGPYQEKRHQLSKNKKHIFDILEEGRKKATLVASKTINEVRGLLKIKYGL